MVGDAQVPLSQVRTIVDGLDHPESVAVAPDCTVWAGGEAGQVYRIDPDAGTAEVVGSTGGFLLGITHDGGRHVYLSDIKQRAVLRMNVDDGRIDTVCAEVEGRPLVNPNHAVFDYDGRLYVTDSGHWHADDGFLFAVDPDGTAHIIDERPCHFPNGVCLDFERGDLYISESTLPGVTKLRLRDHTFETVAELPGMVPDGMALDQDRNIYVGCYRPDAVIRISPRGVETVVSDPEGTVIAAPTNVAFGGRDGRTLYIASLGRWHIAAIRLTTPGLSLWHPARSSPAD